MDRASDAAPGSFCFYMFREAASFLVVHKVLEKVVTKKVTKV